MQPNFEQLAIGCDVRCVLTSVKDGYEYRGGLNEYEQAKRDIIDWMNEDVTCEERFTTMFDLYKLPDDFPGYTDPKSVDDPYQRVAALEKAFSEDIADSRFIPYIQLHEFEALLLADPRKLERQFYEYEVEIDKLVDMVAGFDSPELIDDDNAPSKRIISEIREYEYFKKSAAPIVADAIGLPVLRKTCRHFGEWLATLEALNLAS